MKNNTLLYFILFCSACFFAMTITSAGMYLNDEFVYGAQLEQLAKGHQITYNEGKYGYYSNGTIGNYFEARDNILMYSITYPITAYPIYMVLINCGDWIHGVLIALWGIFGISAFVGISSYMTNNWNAITTKFNIKRVKTIYYIIIGVMGCIFISTPIMAQLYSNTYPPYGNLIPVEILAFVTLNIILFGIYCVFLLATIRELWANNINKQIFAFMLAIFCNSILFWVGTCKDHVFIATLFMITIYGIIAFNNSKQSYNYILASVPLGILIWARPEVGIPALCGFLIISACMWLDYRKLQGKTFIVGLFAIISGSSLLLLNNKITTNNIFIHPFLVANKARDAFYGDTLTSAITILPEHIKNITHDIIGLFILPKSGALSLISIMPLTAIVILSLIVYISVLIRNKNINEIYKLFTLNDIYILILSMSSISYYILYAGSALSVDTGVTPDIRYFTLIYAPILLITLNIFFKLHKNIDIPFITQRMLIKSFNIICIITFIIIIAANVTETYRDLALILNITSFILVTIYCLFIYYILCADLTKENIKNNYIISNLIYVLTTLLVIPFVWQMFLILIFSANIKICSYSFIIPLTDFIYNFMFI